MIINSVYVYTPLGLMRLGVELIEPTQSEIEVTETYLNNCAETLSTEMNADPEKARKMYLCILERNLTW